jgi:hypothetical protein
MNRETFPASQSPLVGDISGPAGARLVTVTGIQRNPVSPATPTQQARLTWDGVLEQWEPLVPGNMSVLLNGYYDETGDLIGFEDISDDYAFSVNNVGLEVLVSWAYGFAYAVFVNGSGVNGS